MSEKEFESEEEEEEEEVEEAKPAAPAAPSPAPAAPSPAPAAPSPAPPAEGEEEEEPAPPAEEPPPKVRKPPPPRQKSEENEGGMTEAQQAMMAAQKKHEEEEARREREYQEKRANEKMTLDEDLTMLKERLAERKKIREEEEAKLLALREQDEEKHRLEREEKKFQLEEKKRLKDLEMKKSSASCVVPLPPAPQGKNYQPKKKQRTEAQEAMAAKAGRKESLIEAEGPTEEDIAEVRRAFLESACKPIQLEGLDPHTLKDKVKQLHDRLVKLETAKYDLDRRAESQAYELLELKEREKQKARAKAKESGLDEQEAAASQHPPKIITASKFDRQVDKRSYVDRYTMYEKPPQFRAPKLYHGTPRPPPEFANPAKKIEELDVLLKSMDPAKGRYVEVAPEEGDAAKPPVEPVAPQVPGEDEYEEPEVPAGAPAAAAPAQAEAAAPAEAAPAAAPAAKQPREVKEAVNPFKAMSKK